MKHILISGLECQSADLQKIIYKNGEYWTWISKIECLKIPKHNSLCSFKYTEISENLKKGCFPVAMVYSSIFINMNSADSKKIRFFNDNEDFDSFAFNDVEGEFL